MGAEKTICGASLARLGSVISIIAIRTAGKASRIEQIVPSDTSATGVSIGVANKAVNTVAWRTNSVYDDKNRRDTLCAGLSIIAAVAIGST